MSEIQNKESQNNETVDSAIHIPVVNSTLSADAIEFISEKYYRRDNVIGTIMYKHPDKSHILEKWKDFIHEKYDSEEGMPADLSDYGDR